MDITNKEGVTKLIPISTLQQKSIEQQTLEVLLRIEKLLGDRPEPIPCQYIPRQATVAKEYPDPRKKGK